MRWMTAEQPEIQITLENQRLHILWRPLHHAYVKSMNLVLVNRSPGQIKSRTSRQKWPLYIWIAFETWHISIDTRRSMDDFNSALHQVLGLIYGFTWIKVKVSPFLFRLLSGILFSLVSLLLCPDCGRNEMMRLEWAWRWSGCPIPASYHFSFS